ncbi:ACL132Cp [Eremothecium gossypii ATCC 10895]|uniref:ACL132Cp n=1 Tax=Eremothecium gossypii (strain ATCC 10895 / CBS 109.51 / FGSC 9923 / NRRL Y-1056) TaxID=284811 RepID=Q75CQ1_EREGS|nr:ACL132Cp [Eremothecium gossypii ATCC 10895]AAS51096.1 ACL132Cp [Eremothecium gossypii ATCC 10895]AEY95386.1 FACL132Cp [Eremothecium gossypii FDAG1]
MTEDEDFTKLGLKQRLGHKSWKARQHGYQELERMFERSSVLEVAGEVSTWWEAPEHFGRFITDSNVVAQESAVGAMQRMLELMGQLERVPETGSLRAQWVPALVEKGVSSSRAGTKAKAMECILMLASFDSSVRQTMELMLPFSGNKLPRLVSSLMAAMGQLVCSFGFVNMKNDFWSEVLAPLPRLAGHADRAVRAETMNFILEVYKWTGKPFLQDMLLEKLKPIQQKDLDKLFGNYDGTIPPTEQPRLFHWQVLQRQREAAAGVDDDGDTMMGEGQGGNQPGGEAGAAPVVLADPFTLLKPSSIVKNFPADFEKNVKSAKWKERVEALQQVYDDLLKPAKKLDQTDDYSFYARSLAQILSKDANLQAATLAANSAAHMTNALREGIAPYGHMLLDGLLDRTKEKKPSVSEAVVEALDLLAQYYGVDNCLEPTIEHMKHKIPQVKMESTNFLTRMLQKQWKPTAARLKDEVIMRMMPDIVPIIVKIVNDTQPSLRDAGFECFATVMKLFGEREFTDELEKLGSLKKKKIYEHFEKIEVKVPPPVQKPQQTRAVQSQRQPQHSGNYTQRSLQNHQSPQQHQLQHPQSPQAQRSNHHQNSSSNFSKTLPHIVKTPRAAASSLSPSVDVRHFDSPPQTLRTPTASTIPTKRGPSSPLKDKNILNNGGLNTKPRLVNRSQTHSTVRASHFNPMSSLPPSSNNSLAPAVVPPAVLAELDELKGAKAKWNKERQELMTKLTSFQTQTSQLNSENQMLQDQLNDVQLALNEKTMLLRSKDLQITKLKNRLATLESELDTALNAKHSPDTPVKSVLEGIQAISPSNGSAQSAGVYGGSNHSDPCISIQPHNPQQIRKTSGGSFRSNAGLTSRFSPLTSSVRVATSSESSDDLPRRVHSLHIMDTTNAVAGSITTNGSSASLLSEESWKRAAEVTNQLKARIERMRAKTRGLTMDAEDSYRQN